LRTAFLSSLIVAACGLVLFSASASAQVAPTAALGDSAYVLGTGGSGVKVRSGPGSTYEILGSAPEGALVRVMTGPVSDGTFNWYQVQARDGAGPRGWSASTYLVAASRVVVRPDGSFGSRQLMARVLAYISGSGIGTTTATGTKVRWGTVAVDPKLIQFGSLMLIDGLEGVFAAEDTGGAIVGATIDVWFPDLSSALNWGSRQKNVTVLREGY
jgi:3D (Asp-Asp-Asp) domain-containing protein